MRVRAFIAVSLPAEIQREILHSTEALQKALPKPLVRWVETQNLHLTLKFLGEVDSVDLERLAGALKTGVAGLETFDMSFNGLGAFPDLRRPRVIWIGLQAPQALFTLQKTVEATAIREGFAREDKPFSPHLTIGRVGEQISSADKARLPHLLGEPSTVELGAVRVDALHIYKSDLHPAGPIYTRLYSLPFKPV